MKASHHTLIPPELDEVLPVPVAARKGGVHPDTLKRCAARGELKIIRLSPRRIGIRKSELQRRLDSRTAA